MSDMRERIARAIWADEEDDRLSDDYSGVSFDEVVSRPRYSGVKSRLFARADAVLTELQEPTPEMVKAANEVIAVEEFCGTMNISDCSIIAAFKAAILAAKKAPG